MKVEQYLFDNFRKHQIIKKNDKDYYIIDGSTVYTFVIDHKNKTYILKRDLLVCIPFCLYDKSFAESIDIVAKCIEEYFKLNYKIIWVDKI